MTIPFSTDQISAEQFLGETDMKGVVWVLPCQAGRTGMEMIPAVKTISGKLVALDPGDWIHGYVDGYEVAKPVRGGNR